MPLDIEGIPTHQLFAHRGQQGGAAAGADAHESGVGVHFDVRAAADA